MSLLVATVAVERLAELVPRDVAQRLFFAVSVVVSVAVVFWLTRNSRWERQLTDRLLYGIPWGTLIAIAGLIGVYAFLQDGFGEPAPVVIPFRAWSYLDPLGMVAAGFSHANTGHLIGNLIGTLVFGSFAEYIWGHHVERQTTTAFHALWTHPVVRAVLLFPLLVALVAVVGTALAVGPVIGFSTVVFAFAGFTLVQYPLVTVIASVAQGTLRTLLRAMQTPEQVVSVGTTTPWFASTAIQAHAVGLLFGVLLGIALLRSRSATPPPAGRLWTGFVLFGISRSLWAVYWFRGEETYVLFRAVGVGLVFLLAAILTYAIVARNQPLFPSLAVENPQSILSDMSTISGRQIGLLLLVASAAALTAPAVAANLTTAGDASLPGEAIEVDGYEITYGENVTDGEINVIEIDRFGETTAVQTSGVIVRNTDRHIWTTAVSASTLADDGTATVRLGGVGWQDSVTATRESWQAVGGESTYRVGLEHAGSSRHLHASDSVTADPIINGQRVSINATPDGFTVSSGNETKQLPEHNESVTVGAINITQHEGLLVAVDEQRDTAVRVATKED